MNNLLDIIESFLAKRAERRYAQRAADVSARLNQARLVRERAIYEARRA
jgi:hypothetical protein